MKESFHICSCMQRTGEAIFTTHEVVRNQLGHATGKASPKRIVEAELTLKRAIEQTLAYCPTEVERTIRGAKSLITESSASSSIRSDHRSDRRADHRENPE